MAACSHHDCTNEAYQGLDKCTLHCEKSSYSSDFIKAGFLNDFNEKLILYISNEVGAPHSEALLDSLERKNATTVKDILGNRVIVFDSIFFPGHKSRDIFDYSKTLTLLPNIHFMDCSFQSPGLSLEKSNCFYEKCKFHKSWVIQKSKVLENYKDVLFLGCIFYEHVSNSSGKNENKIPDFDFKIFGNCSFKKRIEFSDAIFSNEIFSADNQKKYEIEEFFSHGCTFESNFILNNHNVNNFWVEGCSFNKKFEFKGNKSNEFSITNCDFSGIHDNHGTNFKEYALEKCILNDFSGFEECTFNGTKEASFKYVTFESFVNFRQAQFLSGLDIQNINLKDNPNFLGAKITPTNTNRETFRIIKNSFDKLGNHIEANHFFSEEMKKYKEEVKNNGAYPLRFLLFLNEKISNFGQNYAKPIFLIILTAIAHSLLRSGQNNNLIYKIHTPANEGIEKISSFLNDFALCILPFKKMLDPGMEFISLILYIIYISLIWQSVVAIKRHTRR